MPGLPRRRGACGPLPESSRWPLEAPCCDLEEELDHLDVAARLLDVLAPRIEPVPAEKECVRARTRGKRLGDEGAERVVVLGVRENRDLLAMHVGRHAGEARSEEHTSELQSLRHLVCRLLLEKKKKKDMTRRMR